MIRYLADASLHGAIVAGCLRREPAIDFPSAHEARLEGVPDPEVLAFATQQNRILVTSDLKTMPRHFSSFDLASNSKSWGRMRGAMEVLRNATLALLRNDPSGLEQGRVFINDVRTPASPR